MARIYKRLPNNSEDQHDDLEGVFYTGANLEAVTQFLGYVPEIANKHKCSLKIVNKHATFQLGIGQWLAKGKLGKKEIFYVMDHAIVVRRWDVNGHGFEP